MKYKVGDKVRVKSLEWYNENKTESGNIKGGIPFIKEMTIYCSQVLTISEISCNGYHTRETGCQIYWNDDMFEELVESELNEPQDNEQSFKAVDDVDCVKPVVFENIVFPNENYADKVELCLGDEYEIVVEGGRTFVQKKKPKLPRTYEECAKELDTDCTAILRPGYKYREIEFFQKLLICRDVYWKIAGRKMGLDKSWKPDWNDCTKPKYTIHLHCDGHIFWQDVSHTEYRWLSFPTSKMRDEFYGNFKDLIENCKELL